MISPDRSRPARLRNGFAGHGPIIFSPHYLCKPVKFFGWVEADETDGSEWRK